MQILNSNVESKTETFPLVSLVTPGWNGRGFVHRLFDSIIAQTYRPIEYIYVDDGSTDGTAEVVQSYEEKFVKGNIDFKYIRQENQGLCSALMAGWQCVTGKYLSNPEYDDVLFPESVAKRVDYLENHPDCAVVTADAWLGFEDAMERRDELISHHNPNRFDRNHFFQALMGNIIWNAACFMVRMDRFDEVHPKRRILSSKYGPNMQILLPLFYYWNRGFLDEPLSLYVLRSGSLSTPKLTFEQEMERIDTHKQITIDAISKISMSQYDYEVCLQRLEISTDINVMQSAYRHHKVDVFWESYKRLEASCELKTEHFRMAKDMRHWYWKIIKDKVCHLIRFCFYIIKWLIRKLLKK